MQTYACVSLQKLVQEESIPQQRLLMTNLFKRHWPICASRVSQDLIQLKCFALLIVSYLNKPSRAQINGCLQHASMAANQAAGITSAIGRTVIQEMLEALGSIVARPRGLTNLAASHGTARGANSEQVNEEYYYHVCVSWYDNHVAPSHVCPDSTSHAETIAKWRENTDYGVDIQLCYFVRCCTSFVRLVSDDKKDNQYFDSKHACSPCSSGGCILDFVLFRLNVRFDARTG